MKRIAVTIGIFFIISISFAFSVMATEKSADNQTTVTDIRFVLQTQAGITAYTTLTDTISLEQVRQIFTTIEIENNEYIVGGYQLAGRGDEVKLAVGQDGWIFTYYIPEVASEKLFDCAAFDISNPSEMVDQLERAIGEVTSALQVTDTVVSHYDFRNPQAKKMTLHWLFLPNSGTKESTITLPLSNIYLERGYAFCTALSNSKFSLNGGTVDQQGSVSQVIRRWGILDNTQLRAGQTNTMKIEALSFFGNGLISGVSAVYSGTSAVDTVGGYKKDISLAYPSMLGLPLTIRQTYLPLVKK